MKVAFLVAVGALLAGCIQNDGTRFNPIEAVVPSLDEDDERELGREFDRELEKSVRVIHDPVVSGFLHDLGQSIVRTLEPQPFVYRFRVIVDDSLNAFAVPGGYVYFHSGTILVASRIDELAGVMAHEIAHVKSRHFARMQKQSQLPDLLAGVAGMAAAVATGEPGILVATQATNVALKLRFGRELEREADRNGAIFMTRAGYDPAGITRFFERIVERQQRHPDSIPPYLYSHPDVEDRIADVEIRAESLTPRGQPDASLATRLPAVQARLAMLVDSDRSSLPSFAPPPDRSRTDPLLAEAEALARAERTGDALLVLARAANLEPTDPRPPFRMGDLLASSGRPAEAVAAYRRTIELDPSRALVFFQLGMAHKATGDRQRAVYALEQAERLAGAGSQLERRAEWEVFKITFTAVRDAGFTDSEGEGALGLSLEELPPDTSKIVWWAQLGPRFVPYADRITVHWTDPTGALVQAEPAERYRKPWIGSVLSLPRGHTARAGTWSVEARLEDDVIDRRSVRVRSPAEP